MATRKWTNNDPRTNAALKPCGPGRFCMSCEMIGKKGVPALWKDRKSPCYLCGYHARFFPLKVKRHPLEVLGLGILLFAAISHDRKGGKGIK